MAKNKIENKVLRPSRGDFFFADAFKNFANPEFPIFTVHPPIYNLNI